jgi:hypothetical protein
MIGERRRSLAAPRPGPPLDGIGITKGLTGLAESDRARALETLRHAVVVVVTDERPGNTWGSMSTRSP